MACYVPFYVHCDSCGHRNRPHPSPREGIRLVALRQLSPCKGCRATLPTSLPDRPLVKQVLAQLRESGQLQPA